MLNFLLNTWQWSDRVFPTAGILHCWFVLHRLAKMLLQHCPGPQVRTQCMSSLLQQATDLKHVQLVQQNDSHKVHSSVYCVYRTSSQYCFLHKQLCNACLSVCRYLHSSIMDGNPCAVMASLSVLGAQQGCPMCTALCNRTTGELDFSDTSLYSR